MNLPATHLLRSTRAAAAEIKVKTRPQHVAALDGVPTFPWAPTGFYSFEEVQAVLRQGFQQEQGQESGQAGQTCQEA